MDKSIIKEFLKRIELFKGLSESKLDAITQKIIVENHKTGTMIFNENNIRQNLYIIYDGEVELFKRTPYGVEKRLSIFGKYDFLGEGALMDDSPHSTSARTTIATITFALSRDKFKELIGNKVTLRLIYLQKLHR
jgi:aspartate ammonia-lyase